MGIEGNNFNLKWTLEKIEELIQEAFDWINSNDKEAQKVIYVGEIRAKFGMYRDQWDYFKKVLQSPIGVAEEDESQETKERRSKVFGKLKRIEEICRSRMISKAINMKASAAMSIFVLKNAGWTDQQNVDLTSQGEKMDSLNGKISVSVVNTNADIEIDEEGNIVRDDTSA